MQIIELDSFDTAFPVQPGKESSVKRRFMTLFADGSSAQVGGTSYVCKVQSFTGETFALKRMLAGNAVPKDANLTPEDTARITQGHIAAFYEEYKNQLLVSRMKGFPRLYGYGTIAGDPCIIMEWVEGISIRQLARDAAAEGSLLSPTVIGTIGVSVLDVLESAGRLDATLVHRDISPANIMVRTTEATIDAQAQRGSYDVCLIDFGSSTADESANASFTMAAQVWRNGTPEYAAPEMLTQDIPHIDRLRKSQAIDVFALCSVLYELYAGHTPWRVSEHPETSPYRLKTENEPEPLEPRNPEDAPLVAAIMSGLAIEQDKRPSVDALGRVLRVWLTEQGVLPQASASAPGPADGSLLADVLPVGLYTPESVHLEVTPADEGGRRAGEDIPAYDATAARAISRRSFIAGSLLVGAVALIGGGIAARSCKPEAVYDFSNYPTTNAVWDGEALYPAMYSSSNNWVLCDRDGRERVALGALGREPGRYGGGIMRMFDPIGTSNRYGFVTVTGDAGAATLESAWLILPRYADAGDFSEGGNDGAEYARLAAVLDDAGLWGYIDTRENQAIAPAFLEAKRFSCGYAAVRTDGDLWGLIDEDGNLVVKPQFAHLGQAGEEGLVPAAEAAGSAWGYIGPDGAWEIEGRFARARRFSEGLAACMPDGETGLWGYIEPDGMAAIEAQFADARPFAGGLAPVQDAKTQLWGLIDGSGAWRVEPKFLSIGEASGRAFPSTWVARCGIRHRRGGLRQRKRRVQPLLRGDQGR